MTLLTVTLVLSLTLVILAFGVAHILDVLLSDGD